MLRRSLLSLAFLSPFARAAGLAYPERPIKVYHGFGAGGPPDAALRHIASPLERRLGQPIIVENRPGASGTIAASEVVRAQPDGYTLLFGVAANLAVAPAARRSPPYDPTTAFTPIVQVARGPYLWLVRSGLPARTMAEFIALAKREPGKLNYGSPGIGSVHHLATETLSRDISIAMTHVPYAAGGLYPAILSGQIDCMFESMPGPLPHLRSGAIRALAVTSDARLGLLPEVPTLVEQGVPDPRVSSWWGFVGPRRLSPSVVARLNHEIGDVLRDANVAQSLRSMGIEPQPDTPEDFGAYIADQYRHWREQCRRLGLELG